jgi:hypothetical protein
MMALPARFRGSEALARLRSDHDAPAVPAIQRVMPVSMVREQRYPGPWWHVTPIGDNCATLNGAVNHTRRRAARYYLAGFAGLSPITDVVLALALQWNLGLDCLEYHLALGVVF